MKGHTLHNLEFNPRSLLLVATCAINHFVTKWNKKVRACDVVCDSIRCNIALVMVDGIAMVWLH